MLSLFLENQDVFTIDVIIDELADFIVAGTQTTQFTTQTVLSHFATDKESLERLRAEFEQNIDTKGKTFAEVVKDNINIESLNDLSYLSNVIYEALRFNPPAANTSHLHFEKDTKIGDFEVKAFDPMIINIFHMHFNSKYWQDPKKFNPNRFDPAHPDALTPDGKKRPQACWLPFNGGRRICFGKTFAELVLKMINTMLAQSFDFEFSEKGKYDENNLPFFIIGASHYPKVPMKLTKRKKD